MGFLQEACPRIIVCPAHSACSLHLALVVSRPRPISATDKNHDMRERAVGPPVQCNSQSPVSSAPTDSMAAQTKTASEEAEKSSNCLTIPATVELWQTDCHGHLLAQGVRPSLGRHETIVRMESKDGGDC